MRLGRRLSISCLAVATLSALPACSSETTHSSPTPTFEGDWGDPDLYPELGGAYAQYLTALNGSCMFVTLSGTMTIDANNAAQTIIIGRRASDSAILINGATCGAPAATATTLKILNINTNMAAAQVVILDFVNGLFASGTATARGINVDLGAASDALRIRGLRTADSFSFGMSGISTASDVNRDIDVTGVEAFDISMGTGIDIFTGAGGNGTGTGFTTAVTVFGGADNDTITGTAQADTLNGGEGNDTIRGADGDDTLNGDNGNDTFDEGATANGSDDMNGGGGTGDLVSYATRTAAVTVTIADNAMGMGDGESGEADDVQTGTENVTGGTVNDTLTGDSAANTLNGGTGDDTLIGGDGDDILNGDAGDDIFGEGTASNGGDTFNGAAGTDTVNYSGRTMDLVVTMDGVVANDGEMSENDNVKADVENIRGGTMVDNITGNTLANVIQGNAGADILNGGAGDDRFDEGSATNGGDQFVGGDGVDTVDYSARVANLTVTMDGVAADDGLAGETDDVEADVENCYGGTMVDNITGNNGNNTIEGRNGNDTLTGGAGEDTIDGGAGDDTIDGGADGDTIDGGTGDNALTCGAGDDIAFNQGAMGTRAADCEL